MRLEECLQTRLDAFSEFLPGLGEILQSSFKLSSGAPPDANIGVSGLPSSPLDFLPVQTAELVLPTTVIKTQPRRYAVTHRASIKHHQMHCELPRNLKHR